jgi:hypothetical protein
MDVLAFAGLILGPWLLVWVIPRVMRACRPAPRRRVTPVVAEEGPDPLPKIEWPCHR